MLVAVETRVRLRDNDMTDLELKAKAFATKCHDDVKQVRKYTDAPYINHPAAVVEIVRSVPHTEAMLCAAWLHDTVEDTNATIGDIFVLFGGDVATLVEMLTDVSKTTDGNRKVRKAIDREHTAKASPQAKTIKLADLIDNTKTIVAFDPEFAKVYLAEKRLLLDVLGDGDKTLFDLAMKQIAI